MHAPVAAALAVAVALAGCGGAPVRPRTVSLRMSGDVPTATVTIDDIRLGALAWMAKRGVALPPGRHRVTVEADGYFPWDRLIDAKDAPVVLAVDLVKVPD